MVRGTMPTLAKMAAETKPKSFRMAPGTLAQSNNLTTIRRRFLSNSVIIIAVLSTNPFLQLDLRVEQYGSEVVV